MAYPKEPRGMLHDVYFLIIRFYEVYPHKSFTLSNDLFQLKDRV